MIRKSATALYKAGYFRCFICDMVVVIVMLPRTMTSIYHQQKACIHAEDGFFIGEVVNLPVPLLSTLERVGGRGDWVMML